MTTSSREEKLIQKLGRFCHGKENISGPRSAVHFFEAALCLCKQKSPSNAVESLVSGKNGIKVLHEAVRCDLSPDFIKTSVLSFLAHLKEPSVKIIGGGYILEKLLIAILMPTTFWRELLLLYEDNELQDDNLVTFAWLCLEIVISKAHELEVCKGDVQSLMKSKSLLNASETEVRHYGYKVAKFCSLHSSETSEDLQYGPGGRHDNDFKDFHEISIYPTNDELLSKEKPYLKHLDHVFEPQGGDRAAEYIGWLFRMLREDMLEEIKEGIRSHTGKIKGRKRHSKFGDLSLINDKDAMNIRTKAFTITLFCERGMEFLNNMSPSKRAKFFEDPRAVFRHNSLGVLCSETSFVAFGFLVKLDMMTKNGTTALGFQLTNGNAFKCTLKELLAAPKGKLTLLVIDAATFAYEPILRRLQALEELPLEGPIIGKTDEDDLPLTHSSKLDNLIAALEVAFENGKSVNLQHHLELKKPVKIEGAQLGSLINGLSNSVSQIQGPPGTGKSFIGALIVLILYQLTSERILVLSFTNHALDQFITDLGEIGVEKDDMVRLGQKASAETEELRLENRAKDGSFRMTHSVRSQITNLKLQEAMHKESIQDLTDDLKKERPRDVQILEWLEFSDFEDYWDAFQVPGDDDDFSVVRSKNRPVTPEALYRRWRLGDPFRKLYPDLDESSILKMDPSARADLDRAWCAQLREQQLSELTSVHETLERVQRRLTNLFDESNRQVLNSMRLICCTTTGASKYQSIIETARPGIVMVEEAGEILEAHVTAALSPTVKQLVLIGDHKQLRPKINNYSLSVERGDGFDLNVSMFERRIRQNHHYTVLQEQHRSHPEISNFARRLSYETLIDSPKTETRDPVLGLQSRIVFVHHEKPEEENDQGREMRDPNQGKTKRNRHEAEMVLKTVKYLSQQGYRTENMVVLTPYLGQLLLLKSELSSQHDPYLDDLDCHELVKSGLMNEAAAKMKKGRLRLSTIDNYQGEEADIVIVSLTRSNPSGDIGFLYARERLVVLMSRARNGIILFGNMHTFGKSKKGRELWNEYFTILGETDNIYDGLPVQCQQHPERTAILKMPSDFDENCPEGGCGEKCGKTLSCGKHNCERCCHRLDDHSKAPCHKYLQKTCERGHTYKYPCGKPSPRCDSCVREDRDNERRLRKDLEMEKKRMARQNAYAQKLQEVGDEIDHERRVRRYAAEEHKEAETLEGKRKELQRLKEQRERDRKKKENTAKNKSASAPSVHNGNRPRNRETGMFEPEIQWEQLKGQGESNAALDKLMELIGLESVKDEFLTIKSYIDTKIRQDAALDKERFSCTLLGNPGTGKTTVARLYAEFLMSLGAIPGDVFKETTGSKLASQGVKGCEQMIDDLKDKDGGVLFIDEAYQLSSGNNPGGKAVLDYLLAEVENLRGKVVFVLAGYDKEMESFFSHNPGFPSRFPITMKFQDYNDAELLDILQMQLHKKFNGGMSLEDGEGGLYARIVARRVGKGRGKVGFGNARAIENALDKILKRQAKRFRQEKLKGVKSDEMLLTREDIIGPEPSSALDKCEEWKKLNNMIGLDKVKSALKVFRDAIIENYQRELDEEPLLEFSLNRLFLGKPGTGKTTVAKLFGKALAHLGMLSNGDVVTKNPSDFVGSALGDSESKTKGILSATVGKVLVIDEAYGLYGGDNMTDPYRTAVVDTIVAEVQSVPGEDRCVLLLGYYDQMEKMFQHVNPGLSRRFPFSSAFIFEDFGDKELSQILDLKLQTSGFKTNDQGRDAAMQVLGQARNRPNFGNAGEIDILLDRAKASHQKRKSLRLAKPKNLEAVDFDENFARATCGNTDIRALFKGDVGREGVIELLEGYVERVADLKSVDMDPKDEIPFSFLFRGPPGTGKTTVARKMGKVYYDMGFLAEAKVVECSATDLIGSYVGQTGPKVQDQLKKALGKVLFIDEAYRLAGGVYGKEAIDELVDSMTKPEYQGKLIIILAGYVNDINGLLSVNPGMTSRFPETVDFEAFDPEQCFQLLRSLLMGKRKDLKAKGKVLDISCIGKPRSNFKAAALNLFQQLSEQEGWANARDVKEVGKKIFSVVPLSSEKPGVSEDNVLSRLKSMLQERMKRANRDNDSGSYSHKFTPESSSDSKPAAALPPDTSNLTRNILRKLQIAEPEPIQDELSDEEESCYSSLQTSIRDAGVSDEVWEQLEKDKAEEEEREKEYHKLKEQQRTASDESRDAIVKQLIKEEERRKKIAAEKAKLKLLGKCPVGFNWIKQAQGYRCAGGSHYMSDEDVSSLD